MPRQLAFPYGQNEFGRPTWVGIVCNDLRTQRRFYEEVLKMRPEAEDPDFVAYGMGGIYRVELIQCDRTPDYPAPGIQLGFEHPQLKAMKGYLERLGVPTTPLRTGYATRWFKARDPEGNVINFTTRTALEGRVSR